MRRPHCHRSLNSPLTPATALAPVAAAVVDRRGHCGRLGRLPDVVVVRCWRLSHIAGGGGPRGSCGVAGGGGWGWRRPAQRRRADAPCRGRRPSRRPPAADGGHPDEGPHACRRSHRRGVGRRTGHPSGERCVWQCYLQGPTLPYSPATDSRKASRIRPSIVAAAAPARSRAASRPPGDHSPETSACEIWEMFVL